MLQGILNHGIRLAHTEVAEAAPATLPMLQEQAIQVSSTPILGKATCHETVSAARVRCLQVLVAHIALFGDQDDLHVAQGRRWVCQLMTA